MTLLIVGVASAVIKVIDYILGDVNNGEVINVKDVMLFRRYLVRYNVKLFPPMPKYFMMVLETKFIH